MSSPNDQVQIGIVGCGGIAAAHVAAYQACEHAQVVAVMDVDAERAQALATKVEGKAYSDLDEMLDKEKLDGVSLLTPPRFHRDAAVQVLERGVHVFSEKPLAFTAAEGQEMVDTAAQHGALLLVAVCHRFHEPVLRAKKLIAEGALGTLTTYRNRFGYRTGVPDDVTRLRGGILLDNGAHSADLFRFLVGEATNVLAWAPTSERNAIEDLCNVTAVWESSAGAGGVIELNGAAAKCPSVIEVYGTEGTAVIRYGGPSEFLPAGSNDSVPLDDNDLPGSHRFEREIAHFVQCIRGEMEPAIGGEEGVQGLALLEATYEAIRTGRTIGL